MPVALGSRLSRHFPRPCGSRERWKTAPTFVHRRKPHSLTA